jgi:Protease II
MNIPELKKIKSEKRYHNTTLEDHYSWVDQPDILDVLKNPNKLHPDVKKYIEENNLLTEEYFKDVKDLQKNLFNEIKGKIKLDDTGLKYKDKRYYYWFKTEAKGNYGKRMRQLIDGSKPEEVFFDGDLEKKKSGSEYFGVGTVSTSYCDNFIAYSLDLKGSEYYTIYLRDLRTGKNERDIIENTSGSVTWALNNKSFFYSKLDQYHRTRQIFKHVIGTLADQDPLYF